MPFKNSQLSLFFLGLICLLLTFIYGCGFHLRGNYDIPKEFMVLRITSPAPSFDALYRTLRQHLKMVGIQVVDAPIQLENAPKPAILTILNQSFSERTTAYGPDVQVNRAIMVFQLTYQIMDASGKNLIPLSHIEVQRELAVNPNQLLGTEFERKRIRKELYVDASLQLIRQLSTPPPPVP